MAKSWKTSAEIPENKSTSIELLNPNHPSAVDSNMDDYIDKEEYYQAAHVARHVLGRKINVPVGEWLKALCLIEFDNDNEAAIQLISDSLTHYNDDIEVEITLKE